MVLAASKLTVVSVAIRLELTYSSRAERDKGADGDARGGGARAGPFRSVKFFPRRWGNSRARGGRGRGRSTDPLTCAPGPGLASRPRQEATVFNSDSQSGVTKPASRELDHRASVPLPFDLRSRARRVSGIDVRRLTAGSEVTIDTVNSRYHFVILDEGGRRALVHGGRYFDGEAKARIEGSTLGGTLLWVGWIGEGLCLELSVQGKRVGTSRVRSIVVGPAHSA